MELKKIRAVVFDLDGTLLDTLQDIGAGANTALHRSGIPEHDRAAYRRYVGHGIRTLFEQALPAGKNTDEVIDRVLKEYQGYYPEHCTVHTVFFPGVEEMVKKMHAAGYTLGVLSNKTERTTLKIIHHFFPDDPFSLVWGNNGTRPLKPALDAGYLLLDELGVKPEEVLYIGDGDTDMEFASKMGFFALGVTWGYRDRDELIAAGADMLADSTEEIEALLKL